MRGMAGAQARIGDTLDGFYADNSDAAMTVHAYKRATEDLDSRIVTDIEGPYRATVLEPVRVSLVSLLLRPRICLWVWCIAGRPHVLPLPRSQQRHLQAQQEAA